jgi:hypothetical protein
MRLANWRENLESLVQSRQAQPFAWGVSDCSLWAADVVMAITGRDPMAEYRGRYRTERGALRVMRRQRIEALVSEPLPQQISPRLAQPGDVGVIDGGKWPALVARVGGCWMAQGADGLVVIEPSRVHAAWRCA